MTPTTSTVRARLRRHSLLALPVAGALALAACSSGSGATQASSPAASPSTGVNALTGLTGPVGPVVAIKVPNTKEAWPQSGLPQAGQVWVEEIEGGHLRLIAMYSGDYPTKIGPVRSARETDLGILPQLGKPGFAYAGADTPVLAEIGKAANAGLLVDIGEKASVDGTPVRPTAYSTDPARTVPYNFYANGQVLADFASKGGATPPAPGFSFGPAAPGATSCTQLAARWSKSASGGARWDAGAKDWVITFSGKDLLDRESNQPITATDVVVLRMKDVASTIDRSNYKVPVLQSYSSEGGDAIVMRDGTCTTGRWSRTSPTAPTTLTTASGAAMTLAPGHVWVFTVGLGPDLNDGVERTATTS